MSDAPHGSTALEEDALIAFIENTVKRAREGKLDLHNSLASIAIVITTWARDDPQLYDLICKGAS